MGSCIDARRLPASYLNAASPRANRLRLAEAPRRRASPHLVRGALPADAGRADAARRRTGAGAGRRCIDQQFERRLLLRWLKWLTVASLVWLRRAVPSSREEGRDRPGA